MAPAREQRRRFATQCLGRPGRRLFGRGPFCQFPRRNQLGLPRN